MHFDTKDVEFGSGSSFVSVRMTPRRDAVAVAEQNNTKATLGSTPTHRIRVKRSVAAEYMATNPFVDQVAKRWPGSFMELWEVGNARAAHTQHTHQSHFLSLSCHTHMHRRRRHVKPRRPRRPSPWQSRAGTRQH